MLAVLPACSRVGTELRRRGDEIVVAGRMFHTGVPVVLWTDPGGYDAYRTEKRFVPWAKAAWRAPAKNEDSPDSPARFGVRFAPRPERGETDTAPLTADEFERVRGGGWDLELLRQHVDQFVLHYDVCGTSRQCFRVLHDFRGLSVHFMIDIDGTIYQTLDVKEKAWHATIANNRSVGVEIANMGAYARDEKDPLNEWYTPSPYGWAWFDEMHKPADWGDSANYPATTLPSYPVRARTQITLPPRIGDGGVRRPGPWRPSTNDPVFGPIHGRMLRQMDFTPEQYRALIGLTAALHAALPKIKLDYPRDADGNALTTQLPREHWQTFQGVLGHYHIQSDKADPGPALDWEKVIRGAKAASRGH